MKLTLADATYFKDSITIISELVNEARFKVTKDGLELVAMDPANVAMVLYKLLASAFTEYDVEKDAVLAINLPNLKQILRRVSAADILTLEVFDNKLQVTIRSDSVRKFSLPIIDVEERNERVPNLSFPVVIKLPSTVLNSAIDDADIVGESVSFIAEPEKFSVLAEGDTSKAHVEIAATEENKIKSETTAKLRSKYSLEYLKKMMLGSKLSSTVTVSFNQDYPLRLDYTVVDKVNLSFILAPRVEND
ncbi:MAG: proliferating cell nuclear antigen (pcna) [Candidatus Aenigmarchaeota archaeon]|nr:proliferating cell nuclear antigen (pcna) [Candidatus Aenigmarchaeota archaeon]